MKVGFTSCPSHTCDYTTESTAMMEPSISPSLLLSTLLVLLFLSWARAQDDECKPGRWSVKREGGIDIITWLPRDPMEGREIQREIQPGEINCRLEADEEEEVNYNTCENIADRYDMEVKEFFFLNPDLKPDCSNIEPNTRYCVRGCKLTSSLARRVKCGFEHL